MEREARARERREEREHKRAQRRADRKQERLEAAATKKAGALEWRFFIPPPENVVDEDPFLRERPAREELLHELGRRDSGRRLDLRT